MAKKHKKRGTILEVIGVLLFLAGMFFRIENLNLGVGLIVTGFALALLGAFINSKGKSK